MDYFKYFVLGSSFLMVVPFYTIVVNLDPKIKNYSFENYVFVAPLYLGAMAVLSLYLRNTLNLTKTQSLLLVSIIAPTFTALYVWCMKMYNIQWWKYAVYLYVVYFIVFNFLFYYIESLFSN